MGRDVVVSAISLCFPPQINLSSYSVLQRAGHEKSPNICVPFTMHNSTFI